MVILLVLVLGMGCERKVGGVFVKTADLRAEIEKYPNQLVGFALQADYKKRRRHLNATLDVHNVWLKENEKTGEYNLVMDCTPSTMAGEGCTMTEYANDARVMREIDKLRFEYRGHLKRCGFELGFITKEELTPFLDTLNRIESVFISGAKVKFGDTDGETGKYFTFKIQPFPNKNTAYTDKLWQKGLNGITAAQLDTATKNIGAPLIQVAVPCPPQWEEPGKRSSFYDLLMDSVEDCKK